MSAITTHVLDLARGGPAAGVAVRLEFKPPESDWFTLAERMTDADGRVRDLLPVERRPEPGLYRLTFGAGGYFRRTGANAFYDDIPVQFVVVSAAQTYHVPLLLGPFGYSTYRGT